MNRVPHWIMPPAICLFSLLIAIPSSQMVAQAKRTPQSADQRPSEWLNPDANTRGLTRLLIAQSDKQLTVNGWGKCHPTDCEWGPVELQMLGDHVEDDRLTYGFATWDHKFSVVHLTMKFENQEMLVQSYTIFKDGSGRANYRSQVPSEARQVAY